MKKLIVALAAAFGVLLTAGDAFAVGYANPVNVPTHQGKPFARFFMKQPLPAFQAAPWYLYWPYNSHFMMPAPPIDSQFAPGGYNPGGYVNPYFPGGYAPAPRR